MHTERYTRVAGDSAYGDEWRAPGEAEAEMVMVMVWE